MRTRFARKTLLLKKKKLARSPFILMNQHARTRFARNRFARNTSGEPMSERLRMMAWRNLVRHMRSRKKEKVCHGKAKKRRRGKGMRSSTRSIPRIDCSRDADQASAEPDDAGPALRGHPTLVRG